MTTEQIRSDLERAGKPISRAMLYKLFAALKIAPRGARECPAQYPEDTSARLIARYGLNGHRKNFLTRRSRRER
jgi:hypothetical protein